MTTDSRMRRATFRPAAESLEERQVLSAGAGNTIAIFTGTIATANTPVEVDFSIKPESFVAPKGRVVLGVDVVPPSLSSADPQVTAITTESGARVAFSTYAKGKALVNNGTTITPSVVTELKTRGTTNYTVKVGGKSGTTGAVLTGFYLVGDTDGDGKVTRTDIKAIQKAMNSTAKKASYKFDADANRDGRINSTDLTLAKKNLGVRTTILPLVTADLDTSTDTGAADRVTGYQTVTLSGVASGGASITYAEVDGKSAAVTTVADTAGLYTINVPLVEGSNKFKVTSTDSFGQTISGTILPVTYKPSLGTNSGTGTSTT